MNMWICQICEHEASRRGNIITHLKLVHSIDDRDSRNAHRKTNKAITLNCEDGKAQTSIDSNEFGQQTPEDELQSRKLGSGIPLLDIQSPERMLQDGGHYNELPRNQPKMISHQPEIKEYEDSEEEDSEGDERYTNLHEQKLMEEQIDKMYGHLKAKKRRILDNVLKKYLTICNLEPNVFVTH